MNVIKEGRIAATGAAITVALGWVPDRVEVVNIATGATITWYAGMAAANAIKDLTASRTIIATGGITMFQGSATVPKGFVIGVDADINVAAGTIYFVAYRGTDGAFLKLDKNGVYVA